MIARDSFLRIKKAAELLGVCANTLRAWGADGKIPEYRHPVNNYRLYKRADLEKLVRQFQRSVTSSTAGAARRRPK